MLNERRRDNDDTKSMPKARDCEGQCQFLEDDGQNNGRGDRFLTGPEFFRITEPTFPIQQLTLFAAMMYLIGVNELPKIRGHPFMFMKRAIF
jgi:hypothetical protein